MQVTCVLFGPLREAVGTKEVACEVGDDATVGDVVARLAERNPGLADRLLDDAGDPTVDGVNVTRNGTNVAHERGLDTRVGDGDVIRFAPPVVGGRR